MDLLREDPQACLRANLAFLAEHSIVHQRSRGCLEMTVVYDKFDAAHGFCYGVLSL